jgi:ribosomal protein S18 acetylase RimI-like enzyme
MDRLSRTCRPATPQDTGFPDLAHDARREGWAFIDRLDREWAEGSNRFNRDGECLLGVFVGGTLVVIAGLNRDPYSGDTSAGRVRHLYVRPVWRRGGLATQLMRELLSRGRLAFVRIRLRSSNPLARRLYEKLGFRPVEEANATHVLSLQQDPGS